MGLKDFIINTYIKLTKWDGGWELYYYILT